MRRLLAAGLLLVTASTVLTACTAPNAVAAAAAEDYVEQLAAWSDDLADAAGAEPVTTDEGAVVWPELADVLSAAPRLDREVGEVAADEPYALIVPVAERVDDIVAELAALEASAEITPTIAAKVSLAASQYRLAFYDRSAALDAVVLDPVVTESSERDALYLEARVAYWQRGIDDLQENVATLQPLFPDTPHGASLRAFVEGQADRIRSGLETAIELASVENTPPVFDPLGYSTPDYTTAVLAPHYARGLLTAELVAAVDRLDAEGRARSDGEGVEDADLPRAADAYRVAVIARLPAVETLTAATRATTDPEHFASQWLLWRMAELDGLDAAEIAEASELIGLRALGADEMYSPLARLEDFHGFVELWPPSGLEPLHEGHVSVGRSFDDLGPLLLVPPPLGEAVEAYRSTMEGAYARTRVPASELDGATFDAWFEAVEEAETSLDAVRDVASDDAALRSALTEVLAATRG